MKKAKILHLILVALTVLAFTSIAAGGRPFTTTLTGEAEIPGPGDPDGSGTATITLNSGRGEVCWEIHVMDITLPASGAHIHVIDPATGFGGVVVALSPPDESGHSSGCTTADADLIKGIKKNPEMYYVNVHTTDYPGGALRGDLSK
jgi:hypothetical protein